MESGRIELLFCESSDNAGVLETPVKAPVDAHDKVTKKTKRAVFMLDLKQATVRKSTKESVRSKVERPRTCGEENMCQPRIGLLKKSRTNRTFRV